MPRSLIIHLNINLTAPVHFLEAGALVEGPLYNLKRFHCSFDTLFKRARFSLQVHFREAGALVEGPLSNLKQSLVQLSRPIRVG